MGIWAIKKKNLGYNWGQKLWVNISEVRTRVGFLGEKMV